MKILKSGIVLIILSVTMWGCGKGNTSVPVTVDPLTGKHVIANWKEATVHGGIDFGASKNMVACQECHGTDYTGGISKVSCLNTAGCHGAGILSPHAKKPWRGGLVTHTLVKEANIAACALCHSKGKNLQTPLLTSYSTGAPGCYNSTLCHGVVGHGSDPQDWSEPANHGANPGIIGRPGAKFSIQACQSCHATPSFGQNPLFTNPKTGMPGGCSSAGCHDQNVMLAHPYVWLPNRVAGITTSHATAGDLSSSCGLCHGTSLNGAVSGGVAPSCMSASMTFGGVTIRCHSNTTMATDPNYVSCTSCHGGLAAGPNGTVAPNTANAHPKHTAVSGVTCGTCHNGAGNGTASHANGVTNVSFLASQAGASAAYDGTTKTCTNVTCHGGNITPAWTATNVGCAACHSAPPNVNKHVVHWTGTIPSITCDACHTGDGPGAVAPHPNGGVPVTGFPLKFTENGQTAKYDKQTTGGCSNVSCHGGKPTPPWTAGGTASDPTYLANCDNCHTLVTDQFGNPVNAPYNNVYNGDSQDATSNYNLHSYHMNFVSGCTDCHSAASLPNYHFLSLFNGKRLLVAGDPKAKGFAASTVGGPDTLIISYTYSSSVGKSSCLSTGYSNAPFICHGVGGGGTNPITGVAGPDDLRSWFQ